MITYTITDIHKDIKYLLQSHSSKALWKPRYYKQLKDYILPDMIRLNQLCNQDGFRSFAICVNDYWQTKANHHITFNRHKLFQVCQQNFGMQYASILKEMDIFNITSNFQNCLSKTKGYFFHTKDRKNTIIIYGIYGFNPTETLAAPYHEYAHALDNKYNFLSRCTPHQKYLELCKKYDRNNPDDNLQKQMNQYSEETFMLQESFADCFAYSCLVLKDINNSAVYQNAFYDMSLKFKNVVEKKHSSLYCGFAATRTMLNRIRFDSLHHHTKKYYLSDGTIDFLNLADICAEVVRQQGYNHENYQTLIQYPKQTPETFTQYSSSQYDQWLYDYLDALQFNKRHKALNPYYRFFTGLGKIAYDQTKKANFYKLLEKYTNPELQPYLNEYRKILKPQLETTHRHKNTNTKPQNKNLALILKAKQQKSRK